jgi:hypothetical protein
MVSSDGRWLSINMSGVPDQAGIVAGEHPMSPAGLAGLERR